jgi:hypothetical protein
MVDFKGFLDISAISYFWGCSKTAAEGIWETEKFRWVIFA